MKSEWVSKHVDSSSYFFPFKNCNPNQLLFEPAQINNPTASLGIYKLSDSVMEKLTHFEPVCFSKEQED